MISIFRIIDRYFIGLKLILLFPLRNLYATQRKELISRPKRILVIRLWALGSSLLTFPMISRLRDHYGPDVQYDLLATMRNIGVFRNQGYFGRMWNLFSVSDVLKLIFRFKHYDIVIDAEEYFRISSLMALWCGKVSTGYGNIPARSRTYTYPVSYVPDRHNLLNCLSLLEPLAIDITPPETMEPLVYLREHATKIDTFMKTYADKTCIALHVGGAETAPERFWDTANWVRLTELIYERYGDSVTIFFTGTAFEREAISAVLSNLPENILKNTVDISGKWSIFELSRFLQQVKVMVSNDTGPMHLAAAMGTRTIGLFGPNIPEAFGAYPLSRNTNLYHGDGKIYTRVHL